MIRHVRTLSTFNKLIPTLKNPPKYIDKNTNSHMGNPTKRYVVFYIRLHFVINGSYVCTREIYL